MPGLTRHPFHWRALCAGDHRLRVKPEMTVVGQARNDIDMSTGAQ
jgi:hypothetical protein